MNRARTHLSLAILLLLAYLVRSGLLQVNFFETSEANFKSSLETAKTEKKTEARSVLPKEETKIQKEGLSILTQNSKQSDTPPGIFSDSEIFCLIQKASAKITLGGDVKILSGKYGPYPDNFGVFAWVYSSHCPENLYSIVRILKSGEVETEIDCHTTSLEELAKESGMQWNVKEHRAEPGAFNIAISGPGQFLVNCPTKGFFLTRRGHFEITNGKLRDVHGCYLWHNGNDLNPSGGPMTSIEPNDRLNENGCFERTNQCVAMMDLGDPGIQGFSYINSTLFSVELDGPLKTSARGHLVPDALENLDDRQRGPTGIQSWESVASIEPPVSCP